MSINTLPLQQEDNYLEEDDVNIDNASKPTIPESYEQDTGLHHINSSDRQTQVQDDLAMIPKEEEEEEKEEDPEISSNHASDACSLYQNKHQKLWYTISSSRSNR